MNLNIDLLLNVFMFMTTDYHRIAASSQSKKCVFNGKDYILDNTDKPYSYDIDGKICVIDVVLGILHLSSRQIYKTDKRGIIMKLFTPFDTRLPSFLVKTKKYELIDYYAVIKIEYDETARSFIGSVMSYIGKVGECDITPELVCTCHWKKKIDKDITKYVDIDVGKRSTIDTHPDSMVISIDPSGCKDIDDAIECIQHDDHIEIRVHIADVSSYIPEGSELDVELSNRIESLYFVNKTINMINDDFATNVCSLTEKNIKRTFTLIANINKDTTIDNIDYRFVQTHTYIHKNTTYDEVDKCIKCPDDFDTHFSKNIRLMFDVGKTIGILIGSNDEYDSHTMVANYMIFTNVLASNTLKVIPNSLIRAHKKPIDIITAESSIKKIDDRLYNIHNMVLMERAMYFLDSERDNIHHGLGVSRYTHFTSPIRRYADIVVHRMIASINNNLINEDSSNFVVPVFKMNHYKKLYRDAMYTDKILNSFDDVCETSGYVVFITSKGVKIYIDEMNAIVNIDLIHIKLEKLVNIVINNDFLRVQSELGEFELNLYQKVKIKLYKLKSCVKMFKTILTEPDIMSIFK
jgi:exosome complex exonuclease DIS3/RRP44